MKRLRISRPADTDMLEAWLHIATDNSTAADAFIDEIRAAMERLSRHPASGRLRDEFGPGIRSVVVQPYIIIYRETDETVDILRVLHGARDIDSMFGA